jgi:hypothetical protein
MALNWQGSFLLKLSGTPNHFMIMMESAKWGTMIIVANLIIGSRNVANKR